MAYKGFKGVGPLKYGSPFKEIVNEPPVDPVVDPMAVAPGEALVSDEDVMSQTINTKYGEEPVIPTGMTTGRDNHLEEVVLTAGPREKTRTEHRLDKTRSKIETSEDTVGGGEKTNRLRRREKRLENRIERQEGRDKKKYARKDKRYWRKQEEQDKVQ